MNIYYYLFGSVAVQQYEGSNGNLDEVTTDEGAVFKYVEAKQDPNQLLAAFIGWNDYVQLAGEKEYEKLKKKFNRPE